MLDLSSPKVIVPTLVFAVVSSVKGVDALSLTLMYIVIYKLLAVAIGLSLRKTDLLTSAGAFAILNHIKNPSLKVAMFMVILALTRRQFPSHY
jgi:hypothetical protein